MLAIDSYSYLIWPSEAEDLPVLLLLLKFEERHDDSQQRSNNSSHILTFSRWGALICWPSFKNMVHIIIPGTNRLLPNASALLTHVFFSFWRSILLTSIDLAQDFLWCHLCDKAEFTISALAKEAKSKKVSYIISAEDSSRPFLTRSELCGPRMWDFRFKVKKNILKQPSKRIFSVKGMFEGLHVGRWIHRLVAQRVREGEGMRKRKWKGVWDR